MIDDAKRYKLVIDLCMELGYTHEELIDYLNKNCHPITSARSIVFLHDYLETGGFRSAKQYSVLFNVSTKRVSQIYFSSYRKLSTAVNEKDKSINVFELSQKMISKKAKSIR